MVRGLSLLLVPICARQAPLDHEEASQERLGAILDRHGLEPDAIKTMVAAWAATERDRPLESWAVEDWEEYHHPSYSHPVHGYEVKKTTFTSPVVKLKTGEAHFTVNTATHSPFPKGDYLILKNKYRVVEGNNPNRTIGNAEIYLHHWLMGDTLDPNPLSYCENDYYWGYGAEMNGMVYTMPDGYGQLKIGSKGKCGLNMHFIRVEDLAVEWEGGQKFNNPNGSWGAAVKNCAECGWAPSRAVGLCEKPMDGTFACCFTYSRCPVNNKADKTHKTYKLQYDLTYTEDLTAVTPARIGVLDVSGGAIEWNIKPGQNNAGAKTKCTQKECVTIDEWTVGTLHGFGGGLCSGEMIWGYTHQHIASINSTFFINNKPHCTSKPRYGTDPSNPVGNEKGFAVAFSECISNERFGNQVRLNKGDKVRIEAWYDVDKQSTRTLPLPGGKHGGIMDLYFYAMVCDPETFGEIYVCRQDTCLPTFTSHVKSSEIFSTKSACEASCGSPTSV